MLLFGFLSQSQEPHPFHVKSDWEPPILGDPGAESGHWGHSLQVLGTVSLPTCAPSWCEDFFQIQDLLIDLSSIIFMLAKESDFPRLVCVESPCKCYCSTLSRLLNRENSETASWKQTYSSNLSFSWSDSRAAQFH